MPAPGADVRYLIHGAARIAYCRSEGAGPGVAFFGGFRSDMTGSKALALDQACRAQGRAFLRFDYTGHGASSGGFEEGTIGEWYGDALAAFDQLTQGPQILVGSSMGGWIALLLALARPQRVVGLVGIAAAPDFTEHLLYGQFTATQKERLQREGVVLVPSCSGQDDYPITRQLIEEARNHLLLARARLDISCPVRLLHGMRDEDVPWDFSRQVTEKLASQDVELHLVKDGDHRLSTPENLELLADVLDRLVKKILARN